MLAYIMITNGYMEVIPVDVDLQSMTHLTIRGRRLSRDFLFKHLQFHTIKGRETPVFLISRDEFDATDWSN